MKRPSAPSLLPAFVRVVALCAASAVLGACKDISDNDIVTASLKDARELHESLAKSPRSGLFIDARAPKYFSAGHIPGAANYQVADFQNKDLRRSSLESYGELMVYGDNPGSAESKALTKRLLEHGYSDVRLFAGGFDEWKEAGLPVEQGAPVTAQAPASR